MTAATPGRDPLLPPDPTGLEAWIRQVLGLAGARASAFAPPPPPTPSGDHAEDADATGTAE
ncbi:hypothetical protein ACQPZZ_37180 [Microbispora sp. CA-135349]|uniref:hypothetical protein n=1 Tax=Microbispora sp. CA-135349 TaxID=3239953 RepID=UPI003D8B66A2